MQRCSSKMRPLPAMLSLIAMVLISAAGVFGQPQPIEPPPTRDVTVDQPAETPEQPVATPKIIETLVAGSVAQDVQGRAVEHLWVIHVYDNGEFALRHRMTGDKPNLIYRVFLALGRPIAITAHGNRLYVIYEDLSVQAIRHRFTQDPQINPFPTMQLPPLPRPSEVLAFAAGPGGPWAVIQPQIESEGDGEPTPARLVREVGGSWRDVALPPDLHVNQAKALLMLGDNARQPAILTPADGNRLRMDIRQEDGWIMQTYDVAWQPGTTDAVAVQDAYLVQREGETLEATLLRRGAARRAGRFTGLEDASDWWAAPGANRLLLIAADDEQNLAWTGLPLGPEVATAPPLEPLDVSAPPQIWGDPMLLIVAVLIIGILLLFATARRDPQANIPRLPADLRPATVNRVGAAIIDLLPALAAAIFLYSVHDPSHLFKHWPTFTPDWEKTIPAATAIGIFVGHTMITELLTGRTLGKWILGCQVVGLSGEQAKAWQIVTRNIFKAVELAAPLLLVMPLLGVHHQRLGDLIARTVVVSRRHIAPKQDD